jgi:hypothetical protein
MKNMEQPEVIKILPYRGMNNEISEGRKTKISLFEDRMEYSVKYTENVRISRSDFEEGHSEVAANFNEEEGVLSKDSISGIVKYISTSYTDNLEPYVINYVDICSSGTLLTFSSDTVEEKNLLYKKLYDWKYGG